MPSELVLPKDEMIWRETVMIVVCLSVTYLARCAAAQDIQATSPQPPSDTSDLRRRLPALILPEGRLPTTTSEPDFFSPDEVGSSDGPSIPPTLMERQISTPPPPTQSPPSTASLPSAAEVLQALFPVLALASTFGGSSIADGGAGVFGGFGSGSGSWEHFIPRTLPAVLLPPVRFPGGLPFIRTPTAVGGSMTKVTSMDPYFAGDDVVQVKCNGLRSPVCEDITSDGTHAQFGNSTSENPKTVPRIFHRRKQWSIFCTKKLEIQTKAPFDKLLSVGNIIIGTRNNKVYNIQPDGTPADPEPSNLDPALDGLTATASIAGSEYIFQGDQYFKYNDASKDGGTAIQTRPVTTGFPGLPTSIDGAFRLNNDTYVFISGSKFYYYQPDVNPPVDPEYSPQLLQSIPGAPSVIDSVLHLNNRPVLYRQGMLYELEPGKMKVKRKIPLKTRDGRGWLKCADDKSEDCIAVRVPELNPPTRRPLQKPNLP